MPTTQELIDSLKVTEGDLINPTPVDRYDPSTNIKFQSPAPQSLTGQQTEADVLSGRTSASLYGNTTAASEKDVSDAAQFLGFTGGLGRATDLLKGVVEGTVDITSGTAASLIEQAGIRTVAPEARLRDVNNISDFFEWVNDKGLWKGARLPELPDSLRLFLKQEGIEQKYVDVANNLRDANDRFLGALGARAETEEDQTFLRQLGAGASSLATALGLSYITKSPAAATGFFGVVQQSDVYLQAIDAGKTPSEALLIADAAGITEGGLEAVGLGQMFKFFKRGGIPGAIAKSAATEFLQEFTQEAAGTAITDISDVTDTGIRAGFGKALGSGIIGGLTGGPAGGVGRGLAGRAARKRLTDPEFQERIAPAILEAIDNEVENQRDIDRDQPLTERGKQGKTDRQIVEEVFEKVQQGIPVDEIFQSAEKREAAVKSQMDKIMDLRRTEGVQIEGRKTKLRQDITRITENIENLGEQFEQEFGKAADKQVKRKTKKQKVIISDEDLINEGPGNIQDFLDRAKEHNAAVERRVLSGELLEEVQRTGGFTKKIDELTDELTDETSEEFQAVFGTHPDFVNTGRAQLVFDAVAAVDVREGLFTTAEAKEEIEAIAETVSFNINNLTSLNNLLSDENIAAIAQLRQAEKSVEKLGGDKKAFTDRVLQIFRARFEAVGEGNAEDFIRALQERMKGTGQRVIEGPVEQEVEEVDEEQILAESSKLTSLRTQIEQEQAQLDTLREEESGIVFGAERTIEGILEKDIVLKGKKLESQRIEAELRGFAEGKVAGKKFQKEETEQVQGLVTEFINTLSIPDKAKSRLKNRLPKIQTLAQLDTALRRIRQSAAGASIRENRKFLRSEIKKILRKTKVKRGQKGRLTPAIQAAFDKLRSLQRGNKNAKTHTEFLEAEQVKIGEQLNKEAIPSILTTLQHRFINLQLRDMDTNVPDPSIFEIALFRDDLEAVRDTGRLARRGAEQIRAEQKDDLRQSFLDLKGFKDRDGSTTTTENIMEQVNFLTETYFTNINKYGLENTVLDVRNNDKEYMAKRNELLRRVDDKLKDLNQNDNYQATLRKKQRVFDVANVRRTRRLGKPSFTSYTKGEVVYLWMILQNEQVREQFLDPKGAMGWTQFDIDRLNGFMTPRDQEFANFLFDAYEEMYDDLNSVYSKIHHVDLPKVDFYSHVIRETSDNIEMNAPSESTMLGEKGSINPSSLKERSKNAKRVFKAANVIDVFTKYAYDVSHYTAYAEDFDIIDSVVKEPEVIEHLQGVMGVGGFRNFINHLNAIKNNGVFSDKVSRTIEKYRQNFVKVALGFKAKIGLGQLASTFAFKQEVPVGAWTKYTAEFLKNPVRAKRIMDKNATIRERGKHFDPEIENLGKLGAITEFATMPIRAGDITAIYMGGWAMYRHLTVDKGLSSEQALKEVADFAERSQQSVMPSNMTLAQKSNNPLHRALVMFRSSPIAMFNVSLQAVADFKKSDKTASDYKKLIEVLAIQNIVIPVVFNTVAMGQRAAFVSGSLVAIPFFGDGLQAIMTMIFNSLSDDDKERVFAPSVPISIFEFADQFIKDLDRSSQNIMSGEGEFEDWMDPLARLLEAQFGLPVGNIFNVLEGVKDVTEGDIDRGVMELLGYPESKVKKVTGGKKKTRTPRKV